MQENLSESLVVNRRKAVTGKRKSKFIMSTRELQALSETAGKSCVTPSVLTTLSSTPRTRRAVTFPSPALKCARVYLVQAGVHTGLLTGVQQWDLD